MVINFAVGEFADINVDDKGFSPVRIGAYISDIFAFPHRYAYLTVYSSMAGDCKEHSQDLFLSHGCPSVSFMTAGLENDILHALLAFAIVPKHFYSLCFT